MTVKYPKPVITTFRVILPRVADAAVVDSAAAEPAAAEPPPRVASSLSPPA